MFFVAGRSIFFIPKVRRLSKRRVAALQLIVSSQRKRKARYDRFHRHARPYRTGDLVLVARKAEAKGKTKKFVPLFIEPFQIVQKKCDNTFLVEDVPAKRKSRTWRRFNAHVAQLMPFRVREGIDWRPEDTMNELDNENFPADSNEMNDPFSIVKAQSSHSLPSQEEMPTKTTESTAEEFLRICLNCRIQSTLPVEKGCVCRHVKVLCHVS